MDDSEDNITPFRLPGSPDSDSGETFRERLRRRRREMVGKTTPRHTRTWQSRQKSLVALVVESPYASATIARKNGASAASEEGIATVLFSENLPPFQNTLGKAWSNKPLLAEDKVDYLGQPVALVIGSDEATCRRGTN